MNSMRSQESFLHSRKRKLLCALVGTVVIASTNAFSATAKESRTSILSVVDGEPRIVEDLQFAQTNVQYELEARGPLSMSPASSETSEKTQEFELNIGRAIDTLRSDYPRILSKAPDFRIYNPNLVVVDPSGVKVHGLKNYQNSFRLVHTVVHLFYCPERSLLTFRMVHDCVNQNIRVSWNAEVVPKAIFGGTRKRLHVDGISVYELDSNGMISQHRVEHLMINDSFVLPERGIIDALKREIIEPDCIPAFCKETNFVAKFQPWNPLQPSRSLFDTPMYETKLGAVSASQEPEADHTERNSAVFDADALEKKNRSRKKFGLAPLTPDEFLELQSQVQQMELEAQQKQLSAASSDATNYPKEKKKGLLNGLFGGVLEDNVRPTTIASVLNFAATLDFRKNAALLDLWFLAKVLKKDRDSRFELLQGILQDLEIGN
eukprot:CAMPEP_0116572964 /NCGR_PEP_ID=MMETSP0397-20121206/18485_1 /TAXON_ID=216820 /ORGANISM="Cyclophora tenuis, Strain ECT3854" /LENGTH=433 /DNA_ID=CAMNT_0004101385 /DNA_START=17 /DNA_END=1316 /DNA_ORIENTATION=+